jgi:hypothetical protein
MLWLSGFTAGLATALVIATILSRRAKHNTEWPETFPADGCG